MEIDASTNLIINMDFHLLCNQTNNPNLITTQIDGKVIAQGMKIVTKCHTMHVCFYYGMHISISNTLFFHIGHIAFLYTL